MKNNLKVIVSATILTISISSAQAGTFGFLNKNPLAVMGGVGVAYMLSPMHKARLLSFDLDKVSNFFAVNPKDFTPVANYVLKALANPANEQDYKRYKKLAEVMGLDNIPPYIAPTIKNSNLLINPQQQNPEGQLNPLEYVDNKASIIYSPTGAAIDVGTEFPIEMPTTWDEYLSLQSNSQELADNMSKAGQGTKPPNYAAHHVVPATAANAQDARDILNKHKIGINDAENGVYLPTHKNTTSTQGIEHNGRHPYQYADKVRELLQSADDEGGKEAVLYQLKKIKDILKNLPRNSDWRDAL